MDYASAADQLDLFSFGDFIEAAPTPVAPAVAVSTALIGQSRAPAVLEDDPVARAKRRVRAIMEDGYAPVIAWSSGKDSSALASITLDVAREMVAEGLTHPPMFLVHSNTGVEQPEITRLARQELTKMRAYAEKHGIDLTIRVGQPTLNASFPVRVIGGRALPSFPDTRGDCSVDWKVAPNTRLIKQAFAELGVRPDIRGTVVMTGVRNDESNARNQKIEKRGEVAEGLWANEHGQLRASPILDWSTDDVWTYIGLASAGEYSSYSDFGEVMRIYRDAGGSSCVIVADMKMAQQSTGCGARTGCWSCTRVKSDKSMEQMISSDPKRYGYMQPLSNLRDFISNTQYDWSRRQFVGRTIDDEGYIAIQADTYSPEMLKELLGYALTAQIESGVEIINTQSLVAIDARWSLYGFHPPFTALKLFFEIEDGLRMYPPSIQRVPKTDVPRLGRLHVGSSWAEVNGPMHGLRDAVREMVGESCGLETKVLKSGEMVINDESDDGIGVDPEGAADFVEFFGRDFVKTQCRQDHPDWANGYMTYLQYGTVSVAKGKSHQIDETLRRTRWRQEHNLHGQQDLDDLRNRIAAQEAIFPSEEVQQPATAAPTSTQPAVPAQHQVTDDLAAIQFDLLDAAERTLELSPIAQPAPASIRFTRPRL